MADEISNEATGPTSSDAGMQSFAKAARVVFNALLIFMIAAVVVFLWRSLFVVREHQVGIILRFGREVPKNGKAAREPGLYFSFPHPIDEQIRVEAKRPHKVETDAFWYERRDGEKEQPEDGLLRPGVHGYGLTGDLSILRSKWTLQYNITDAVTYSKRFHHGATGTNRADEFLRRLLNSAVTQASAGMPLDVVWQDREERLRQEVEQILKRDLVKIKLGVAVDRVFFTVAPPRQVQEEFISVTRAEEERRKLVADAVGIEQRMTSDAKIDEARILAAANADKVKKESSARSDVETFDKLFPQYQKDRELFRRIYVEERLRKIMGQVDEKFVVDKRKHRQLRFLLNSDPRKEDSGKSRTE